MAIYDRDDWSVKIKDVPRASNKQFMVELNDVGYGEFTISGEDGLFTDSDGLFNAGEFEIGNVVRCYIDGVERGAWIIEERDYERASQNDETSQRWTFRGPGLVSALVDAVTFPESKALDPSQRLHKLAFDERAFTFASLFYDTSWTSGWGSAVSAGAVGSNVTTTLNGAIDDNDLALVLTSGTGWDIATPFVATIDQGGLNEESILISDVTGTAVTIQQRGYGDTEPRSHLSGESITTRVFVVDTDASREWPDPDAVWVNATGTYAGDAEDHEATTQWFREPFTTTEVKEWTFFASAQGQMELFVDGEPILETSGAANIDNVLVRLPAGEHQLAVRFRPNDGGAFVVSVGDQTGMEAGVPQYDWIEATGTHWAALAGVWPPPAWTPARVVRFLKEEYEARCDIDGQPSGVSNITLDFTDTADTDSVAWAELVDRYWQLGTPLLDILLELTESACEFYMTPAGTLKMYSGERGQDRTTGDAPVMFRPGKNVTKLRHVRRKGLGNHFITRYKHGWMERHRQPEGSGGLIQRREMFVSLGTADSKAEADRIIRTTADLQGGNTEVTTVELIDTPGATPFEDFDVGDYVLAPHQKAGGGLIGRQAGVAQFISHRVLAIGVAEDENGLLTYTPELVVAE